MKLLKNKGFGVHSPSLYSFITTVLNPGRGYAYYAYSEIERLYPDDAEGMETIYRILLHFHPLTLSFPENLRPLIALALPSAIVTAPEEAQLLVTETMPPQRPDVPLIVLNKCEIPRGWEGSWHLIHGLTVHLP